MCGCFKKFVPAGSPHRVLEDILADTAFKMAADFFVIKENPLLSMLNIAHLADCSE